MNKEETPIYTYYQLCHAIRFQAFDQMQDSHELMNGYAIVAGMGIRFLRPYHTLFLQKFMRAYQEIY